MKPRLCICYYWGLCKFATCLWILTCYCPTYWNKSAHYENGFGIFVKVKLSSLNRISTENLHILQSCSSISLLLIFATMLQQPFHLSDIEPPEKYKGKSIFNLQTIKYFHKMQINMLWCPNIYFYDHAFQLQAFPRIDVHLLYLQADWVPFISFWKLKVKVPSWIVKDPFFL